jgi:predicted metal-dependent hydrolase
MTVYDPLFVRFIYDVNVTRDYIECHETMEELWLEEGKPLYLQGLLQIAVALYHHRNNNISGATKLMASALEKKLPGCADVFMGIDLARLIAESAVYLEKLRRYAEEPFAYYPIDIVILDPDLQLALDHFEPPSHEEEEDSKE